MQSSKIISTVTSVALALYSFAAVSNLNDGDVKLNQLGYTPSASKVAIVAAGEATGFQVVELDTGKAVFRGLLSEPKVWPYSGEKIQQADFSKLQTEGNYAVSVGKQGKSYPFEISKTPLHKLHKAAIKAFYFNRSGIAIDVNTGGDHARDAGHPDTSVKVHESAASKLRPKETLISSPRGWYDAGDYGKYVVNSGISTYTLLAAYEHHAALYQNLNLDIAESQNTVPDLVDEIKWNLDWLETMQDLDGGVYHKLTALQFSDMGITPDKHKAQRYVIGKSVTATLDFAAVMAAASRVMQRFETEFPGVSARYKAKAITAYAWAKENPNKLYKQPSDVATGAYDDNSAKDEFAWAAAELFLLTGISGYFDDFLAQGVSPSDNLTWSNVSALGYISLAASGKQLLNKQPYSGIQTQLIAAADASYAVYANSAYGVAISKPDFVWGSNGDVLNNGIVLIQGYRLTGDIKYMNAAMSTVDYVLGKNATGFSFVTGYGDKTPMNIHHRPSVADDTIIPVPGFIAGGPHAGKQDGCQYTGSHPATTYEDTVCSYSTNEVAINWNAPLVYMLAAAVSLY